LKQKKIFWHLPAGGGSVKANTGTTIHVRYFSTKANKSKSMNKM